MDLISRDDVLFAISSCSHPIPGTAPVDFVDIKTLSDCIKKMPAVDPVKHGRWVKQEREWVCSECFLIVMTEQRYATPLTEGYNYCPNCGAKMDGAEMRMADFFVYDRNGTLSGFHKNPETAIDQARKLAGQTGDFADVEKRHGSRRRFFAGGGATTIRKGGCQMSRKVETVESRAVKIATKIMRAAGLCRFDTASKYPNVFIQNELLPNDKE